MSEKEELEKELLRRRLGKDEGYEGTGAWGKKVRKSYPHEELALKSYREQKKKREIDEFIKKRIGKTRKK
jgi:hypothetical protein